MNFDAFVNDIKTNNWNVFGAEVYEDGKLTHSYGDTVDNIHDLYSATKTIVSVAVGIAYDRGLIDFNKSITEFLPKDRLDNLPKSKLDEWRLITIQRLLTMSVDGLPFRPEGDDWLDFSLNSEIKSPEEKRFNYSNINVYLICVALTEILGEDLGDFIVENILRPMDISEYEYERSPEGYFYGASKMKLTVHDLSKFGILLYNKGVYQGQRIVSEEYVSMATGIQQMNREGGYGYYIWKYRDGFSINGKWKQKCYILPERGIIVTYLSHIEDDSHDLLYSMEQNILSIPETDRVPNFD